MISQFMQRAILLAENGRGFVHPNPIVGAVIVKNENIIGEGWHTKFGGPHAEIEAIINARQKNSVDIKESTIYVTLEPCSHFGKTPPCTDAIISSGIKKVVYSIDDPNPLVSGKGRQKLIEAGIEVEVGDGAEESKLLNESYLHFILSGRPFVIWKRAVTLDAKSSLKPETRSSLTGEEAKDYTDMLRARADAVMVGTKTARIDNPGLRVRNKLGRDPFRIVLDADLSLSLSLKIFSENSDNKTIIIASEDATEEKISIFNKSAKVITVPEINNHLDLDAALRKLSDRGIIEILVESGETLGMELLKLNLVNRIILFHAPLFSEEMLQKNKFRISGCKELGRDHCMLIEVNKE